MSVNLPECLCRKIRTGVWRNFLFWYLALDSNHVEFNQSPFMNYEPMSIDELVQECAKSSHADAWAEFIRRFHRLIASVVIRCCHEWSETSREVIEDLIQDTYVKLCANNRALLANFRPKHPNAFLGYLKTVTANLAYDYFRARILEREKTVEL